MFMEVNTSFGEFVQNELSRLGITANRLYRGCKFHRQSFFDLLHNGTRRRSYPMYYYVIILKELERLCRSDKEREALRLRWLETLVGNCIEEAEAKELRSKELRSKELRSKE